MASPIRFNKAKSPAKPKWTPRELAFAELWQDKHYLWLQESKDRALRTWNKLDAERHTPVSDPDKLRTAEGLADRALKALQDYEDKFIREWNRAREPGGSAYVAPKATTERKAKR